MNKPLKGFITYSHEDTAAKDELRKRLAVMEQTNELTTWYDGQITPGDEWYEDISENLAGSDILLYLVSAASLASENCNKELTEALSANVTVIPIILEDCDWLQHQLSDFEVLPLKGKPISKWEHSDEGWQNVVDGIRTTIREMVIRVSRPPDITSEEIEILSNVKLRLGNFFMMLKQIDRAIAEYSRAIELNPEFASAYNSRGSAHHKRGEIDKTLADCNKAIELDPKLASAYSNRGAVYGAMGKFDLAIDDCNKAIKLNPKLASAYGNRGAVYGAMGKFDLAIDDCNKAIKLNPKLAEFYANRGNAHREKGEHDLAIDDCNKAIKLNPKLADAYNTRGAAYYAKNDLDNAIENFTTAIKYQPDHAKAYNNFGAVYAKKGELNHAVVKFTKAMKFDPNYAEAYINRAVMRLHLQEWENFKSDFSAARDVGIDIAIGFRKFFGGVVEFERRTGIRLPAEIALMLASPQR